MLSYLNGREQRKVKGKVGVVKRVVRGCCYAELGVKEKEELGITDQGNYDQCSWKRKTTRRLVSKILNILSSMKVTKQRGTRRENRKHRRRERRDSPKQL